MDISNKLIVVRGAGDIASGIIWNLKYAGLKVICLDISKPSCIRREVSFSEAIYEGKKTINDITCIYAKDINEANKILSDGNVALLVDGNLTLLSELKPDVLIDAILAKKNLGTTIDMAELVIGVGPGFIVDKDCNFAIETMRGHMLSHIYESGSPLPDTGIPGLIASHAADRVMHSPCEGIFHNIHEIGDIVKKDEVLSNIEECINGDKTGKTLKLYASIDGVLRGILRDGFYAKNGLKCADIDPRISEQKNCFTISDKARCIAGSVLELCVRAIYN